MQSYGFGWAVKLMVRITLIVPSSLLKMTEKLISPSLSLSTLQSPEL